MTNKPGPKEAQIRHLREARQEQIRRTEQNRKLLKGKAKVKGISAGVVHIRLAKRP
jgi:hypothetical protein